MTEPPRGVVTLAFTDIEGSSAMWEALGDGFREVLAIHDGLLRAALAEAGGYEISTAGDAFFVAFSRAQDAITWCLAIQDRLAAAPWPAALLDHPDLQPHVAPLGPGEPPGLRIRIGVHTGEPWTRPDPTTGRMDYGGPTTNRTARITAAAHGGQLLVSATTWAALHGDDPEALPTADPALPAADPEALPAADAEPLPAGTLVTDLGSHALRGLAEPEILRQLLPASRAGCVFGPIRTVDVQKTNLRARLDTFVGREAELAALAEVLAEGARLVTLLGPGGMGKTRLSEQLGRTVLGDFPGGVWFCDLTEARGEEGIVIAVSRALDVVLRGGDPMAQLGEALARRGEVLLVLDNFEQVVAHAAATVGALLALAPKAQLLVTSRTRLGLGGERVVPLLPLALEEAVQLFIDRAQVADPGFAVSTERRPVVEAIVTQLDRMSLPIELAAARARMFTPEQLRDRLSQRFRLLRGQRRDHTERQSTLRGAIDWSWQLLRVWERAALAQCSVFRDGFTLDAADAVLQLDDLLAAAGDAAPWPEDILQALLDQSLLYATEPRPGHRRLRMYESIRAFAAEKLADPSALAGAARTGRTRDPSGGVDPSPPGDPLVPDDLPPTTGPAVQAQLRAAHAAHYAGLSSDEFVRALVTHGGEERRWQLAFEQENCVAAFRFAAAAGDDELAARCALATAPIFEIRGPFLLGVRLLDEAQALAGVSAPIRGRLHFWQGLLHRFGGQRERALTHLQAALAANVEAGDQRGEGLLLGHLGIFAREQGRPEEAREHFERALALHLAIGNRHGEGLVEASLGLMHYDRGEREAARDRYDRALAIQVEVGDVRMQGRLLGNLGLLHRELGDPAAARTHYERALGLAEATGDRLSQGITLGNLADLAIERGGLDDAAALLHRAIPICDETLPIAAGAFRGSLATVLAARGDLAQARRLFGRGADQSRGRHALELGKLLCKHATVELAAGDPAEARALIAEAEAVAEGSGAGPTSALGSALAKLRAQGSGLSNQ